MSFNAYVKGLLNPYNSVAGFSSTTANLLSVPVYAWACLMTCVVGYLGDKYGSRGYINLFVAVSLFA